MENDKNQRGRNSRAPLLASAPYVEAQVFSEAFWAFPEGHFQREVAFLSWTIFRTSRQVTPLPDRGARTSQEQGLSAQSTAAISTIDLVRQ